jgi:XTP/dITP diphosphohydrolase
MKIVLATSNPGKLAEFKDLSAGVANLELVMAPPGFDPVEDGSTFAANALIKARAAAALTGLPAIADDSGLCVDALDGRPGIHSARYAPGTDADRRTKLLAELKDVPSARRQAAFVCALALVDQNGEPLFECEERWRGTLSLAEQGANGFGFDPLFIPSGHQVTAAELAPAEKNRISHRGMAWGTFLNHLATQKK